MLGALIGIWIACFYHFCLRDQIYSHFSRITNGPKPLVREEAQTFAVRSLALAMILWLSTVFFAVLASSTEIE